MSLKIKLRMVLVLIIIVLLTQIYYFSVSEGDTRYTNNDSTQNRQTMKQLQQKKAHFRFRPTTAKSIFSDVWDQPALNYSQKLHILETYSEDDKENEKQDTPLRESHQHKNSINKEVRVNIPLKDYDNDDRSSKVLEQNLDTRQQQNDKAKVADHKLGKKDQDVDSDIPSYELRNQKNLTVQDYVPALPRVTTVNCAAVATMDSWETKKARDYMDSHPKVATPNDAFIQMTSDCAQYKQQRGYVLSPLTQREKSFPLAFSIAVYKDLEQMERLLRAIYMPQNYYCIHVDKKAAQVIHDNVRAITNCFDNVFIASHLDDIIWGGYSVLLPAINCMKDMVKHYRRQWLYFINLTAQEFPLRSNYELVRILQALNGNNEVFGSVKNREPWRTDWVWNIHYNATLKDVVFQRLNKLHTPPPFNLTIHKGSLHGAFTRKFVEFMMETEIGQTFSEWCKDTARASEHYWNTLNFNKHIAAPGGFNGPDEEKEYHYWHSIIRAKHWKNFMDRTCHGKFVRGICVFGIGDLPWLTTRKKLFANKLLLEYEPLIFDCLEEHQRNRTMTSHHLPFDDSFYRSLPTSKYGRNNGL